MRSSLRFPLTALALAALALSATGCEKPGDKAAKPETAAAGSADKAATAIPGLATEKDQVSYMIGMAMAKQWEPIKDEIDVDVLARAIKSAFAGDKLLLTDEQAAKISESFGERMQAKQIAKLQAEARQNAEAGAAFLADNGKKPGVQTTASGL